MAGIYIHIPFCRKACHYCDFHFSTNLTYITEICTAICAEATLRKDYLLDQVVHTIYFGGGTPSILPLSEIEKILSHLKNTFRVDSNAEITLEANPDDLTSLTLDAWRKMGINRLSIGIQSFDAATLTFLNRVHSRQEAIEGVLRARQAGFHNINVDLIYAIPGRDKQILSHDLDVFRELNPEHISAYSLTIEEKTVFGRWAEKKKLAPESEEENANQFELVRDYLTAAGYDHYEISNYARPGFISKHNSNYWKHETYLGLGPGAHSFNGHSRQANVAHNARYPPIIFKGVPAGETEILTAQEKVNEFLLTGLRTQWGCNLHFLKATFGFDLAARHPGYIESLVSQQLVYLQGNCLLLTKKGQLMADKIASDFFWVD